MKMNTFFSLVFIFNSLFYLQKGLAYETDLLAREVVEPSDGSKVDDSIEIENLKFIDSLLNDKFNSINLNNKDNNFLDGQQEQQQQQQQHVERKLGAGVNEILHFLYQLLDKLINHENEKEDEHLSCINNNSLLANDYYFCLQKNSHENNFNSKGSNYNPFKSQQDEHGKLIWLKLFTYDNLNKLKRERLINQLGELDWLATTTNNNRAYQDVQQEFHCSFKRLQKLNNLYSKSAKIFINDSDVDLSPIREDIRDTFFE